MANSLLQTLMLSPKNTPQQNAILLQTTNCHKFFLSSELAPVAKSAQAHVPGLILQVVEEFDYWLEKYTRYFPFERPLEVAQWDPILVLHSSGSTGTSLLAKCCCAAYTAHCRTTEAGNYQ